MKSSVLIVLFFLPLFMVCQNISETNAIITHTQTVLLCDSGGQDVYLASGAAMVNYGNHPTIGGNTWTCGGSLCLSRGLFKFYLPSSLTIIQANLQLFADLNWSTAPTTGPANAGYLRRVVAPWNEFTTTWGNQPSTTTANEVVLPASLGSAQNYTLNVTSLVKDMQINGNYGFMLSMQDELNYYKSLQFASSDNSDPAKCPVLNIFFSVINSLTNEKNGLKITVAPQPFENSFNISCEKIIERILIRDLFGNLIREEQPRTKEFEFSGDLSSGVYYVEGYDNTSRIFSQKIICLR